MALPGRNARVDATMAQTLDLSDIQATALRRRPMPYCGAYVFLRINDPEHARTLLSRLIPKITTSAEWQKPVDESWINIVFTHRGLAQLGLAPAILDGFPQEFRIGMAERKEYLGDIGQSDPANWDHPFGSSDLHTALMLMARTRERLEAKLAIGHAALQGLPGVEVIGQLDIALPENFREHFGFVDGISRPYIEGQGGPPLPGQGEPFKAGEFFLGYVNELGELAKGPGPEAYGGTGHICRSASSIKTSHSFVASSRNVQRVSAMKS